MLLDELTSRRGWRGFSYCLMPNHYHLVLADLRADRSLGGHAMAQRPICAGVQSGLTALDGHLFQGRFHSVLVESDWHLLELSRYLALNPVRAGLCADPGDWQLE